MHNIATIYRFNTPFLDLEKEKGHLISVVRKIEKSIELDGISFEKVIKNIGNYHKITLNLEKDTGKVEFFYISNISTLKYYLPVFKLNVFLNNSYVSNNNSLKNTVFFLNNIFECFDGLAERDFLIDLDNRIFYRTGLFKRRKKPSYDFSDIDGIKSLFERKQGLVIVEDFIKKFSNKAFELSVEKSKYYYTLHSIFLYFIYLVFLMSQNIERTENTKKDLEKLGDLELYEGEVELMKKRLSYVESIHLTTFNKYKNRLELFFKLF